MPDPAVTVPAPEELDVRTAPQLSRDVERQLDGEGVRELTIDFGGNTFIDSSGMGALIGVRERCLERGVSLTLRSMHERVRRTLTTAGLLAVFTVVD